ncbi:FBL15 [Acrasis kona]|uniref:FBL15 n=1 Tax=Acrasis kona TaxID=1008807 RepID=A0AAW2Z7B8_9EUKA
MSSIGKRKPDDKAIDKRDNKRHKSLDAESSSLDKALVLKIISFLTLEESIRYFSLLSKSMQKIVYEFLTDLTLSYESWSHLENINSRIIKFTSKLTNLKSLTIDGFDEFNDMALNNLLHKNVQSTFAELHIRDCAIVNPRVNHDTLKVLKISTCNNISTIAVQSTSLETFEVFDCDFERAPKLIQCTSLANIKLNRCRKLTDHKLGLILKQFIPNGGYANSQSQGEEANERRTSVQVDPPQTLKKLYLTECEPLSNPVMQSMTLVDLRFINCRSMRNPIITCPMLQNLQLTWCENLENLTLGCDTLKALDLTGTGVNNTAVGAQNSQTSSVRESILSAVKTHYSDQVTVSY